MQIEPGGAETSQEETLKDPGSSWLKKKLVAPGGAMQEGPGAMQWP